jgi:hypothetical protein
MLTTTQLADRVEQHLLARTPRAVFDRVVADLGLELPERELPRFADGDPDLELATFHLLRDRLAERLAPFDGAPARRGWASVSVTDYAAHCAHTLVRRGVPAHEALDAVGDRIRLVARARLADRDPSDVASELRPDVREVTVAEILAAA